MSQPPRQNISREISELHAEIDQCTVCQPLVASFVKPRSMRRGESGTILIVGIAPGNREIETNAAFSGQSGKRLDKWLVAAGAAPQAPRKGIYLTSVVKCQAKLNEYRAMARNCRRFLHRQLFLIQPKLVITLGQEPYEELRFDDLPFSEALCNSHSSSSQLLTTSVGFHYMLLPWPHPSGLNRWHNDAANLARLEASFEVVRKNLPSDENA